MASRKSSFQGSVSQQSQAAEILTAIVALSDRSTPSVRRLRREYSRRLRDLSGEFVRTVALAVAEAAVAGALHVACELIAEHREAFAGLKARDLKRLCARLAGWGAVDLFGLTLAGQAWREGILSDATVLEWARSADRWLRRLALVTTVPLNSRARGGKGDAARTLKVCRALVDDRDDMVVKALSWALRELAKRDPQPVIDFLKRYGARMAARVAREVENKLKTGLKNPRPAPRPAGGA
jgi:3-methyladenine DNA glycosylase AlkD